MTSEQARALFSAAYEYGLDAAQQDDFERALAADPLLAREYEAFRGMLDAMHNHEAHEMPEVTPDLLAGVQKRLRDASGGRFYADRFSERAGLRKLSPWTMLLALVVGLVLVWIALIALRSISLGG